MNYRKEEKAKYSYGVVVFAGRVGWGVGDVRRNEKLYGPLAVKNRTVFSFTQIAKCMKTRRINSVFSLHRLIVSRVNIPS